MDADPRETSDIADEIVRLVVRRLMEGAGAPAISAGITLALNRLAGADALGAQVRAIAATMLAEHAIDMPQASPVAKDQGKR